MSFAFEVIEPKLFAGAAADEVVATVLDVSADRDRCSICLAGGSTPVAVYRALTVPPRVDSIAWDKIDLFLGDERWVPVSDPHSNARMVNETLLSRLSATKPRFFPVQTDLPDPEAGANQYADILREYLPQKSPQGVPVFDLVLLGMGDDGHTASIFPGSALLSPSSESQKLAAVQDWPNQPGSYRISLTPSILMAAQKVIFLVQGPAKAEMLVRAFNDKESAFLPVHLFRQIEEKVTWLLDSEAARLL